MLKSLTCGCFIIFKINRKTSNTRREDCNHQSEIVFQSESLNGVRYPNPSMKRKMSQDSLRYTLSNRFVTRARPLMSVFRPIGVQLDIEVTDL